MTWTNIILLTIGCVGAAFFVNGMFHAYSEVAKRGPRLFLATTLYCLFIAPIMFVCALLASLAGALMEEGARLFERLHNRKGTPNGIT